jgi:predicted small secreted protein
MHQRYAATPIRPAFTDGPTRPRERESTMKRLLPVMLVLLSLLGCSTWEGVGKDISAVGDAVQNTGKK